MSDQMPILAEHEGFNSGDDIPTSPEPEQTPHEKTTGKLVDKLLCNARRKRKQYDDNWLTYYKYFRGDQWLRKRASYRNMEVINFVFRTIQSFVPIMTDARPKPSFSPQDPTDLEFSDVLNQLFDADWQKGGWLYKLTEVLYDSHIYGTGITKLWFDSEEDYGLGRIQWRAEDPYICFPDPESRQINEDSRYFLTAEPMEVEKIKLKWSDSKYAPYIKSDVIDIGSKDKGGVKRPLFVRNYDRDMPVETYSADIDSLSDQALVVTLYIKPSDTEQIKEEHIDPETKEANPRYILKKKYPKGRKIVRVNNYILEDGPLDNDDLKFPFQKCTNYVDPHEFWGISEVEQLKGPQDMFNKLISFTMDVLVFTGNPIWLIPSASGVAPGAFHNAPGMQVPFDGTQPPQRVEGTQLQPYVLQLIDRLENWFNDISGSTEVSRGATPGSVTAASAIENLQQSALTRIRQKMRNMDSYLVDMGEQYVQLVLQHYTVPRIFRLTNKDGLEKYFRFHVKPELDSEGNQVLDKKGDPIRKAHVIFFDKDTISGKMIQTHDSEYVIRGNFDVKVSTASGLPFSKAEKENRILQLFDREIIDREEVLKQIEFPNADNILERVKKREQEAAELAAQQQQQPPQGG